MNISPPPLKDLSGVCPPQGHPHWPVPTHDSRHRLSGRPTGYHCHWSQGSWSWCSPRTWTSSNEWVCQVQSYFRKTTAILGREHQNMLLTLKHYAIWPGSYTLENHLAPVISNQIKLKLFLERLLFKIIMLVIASFLFHGAEMTTQMWTVSFSLRFRPRKQVIRIYWKLFGSKTLAHTRVKTNHRDIWG